MMVAEIGKAPALSARQFEIIVDRWGMSQNAAARWLGIDDRTLRRWKEKDEFPAAVAILLRFMYARDMAPADIDAKLEGVRI